MLRQIIYVSTAKSGFDHTLLPSIELQSERNNARNGLSGLLMFDGVRFLQVLEGPAKSVQTTLDRIRKDPRHHALVILRDREVEIPGFGNWDMKCRDVTGNQAALVEMIAPFVKDTDKSTRALFESFAEIREQRAA